MQLPFYLQKTLASVLLLSILCLAFWIRIQGRERLPDGQFTENDAYLYHWQAGIIADQGHLPERDMDRWLPLGRDNQQLLPLYAYAIAYTHKAFPWLSLYDIQLYAPAFCFTLGLGVLLLYLTRCYGVFFATLVGVLLATLPGSVERSSVGFGDRDAWCWMLGTLAVTSYLWKEQIEPGWHRYLATALSGFIVFLGDMSWEGFGIFVLMIVAVELYKFCTTDTEHHLKEYLLYLLMFVPWLTLISPAYRSGYGFSMHLSSLLLAPTLVIFALRWLRSLLLHFYEPLRPHARKLAWGLTLLGIAAGVSYLFRQAVTFETTAFAFRESRLMQTMTELADPHFGYWIGRYGTVFMLGSLGMTLACLRLWKWYGLPLAVSLGLFFVTTFFRWQISAWIGASRCDTLFLISLGLTTLSLGIPCLRKAPNSVRITGRSLGFITVQLGCVMLVWFLLWVALSRGGKRYDFFIGLPLAYGTASLLWLLPAAIGERMFPHITHRWIAACFTLPLLILVLFFNPLGGHAHRATAAASKWRHPTPGEGRMAKTLQWMQTKLPEEAVIAANWSYGSRLNVLGGVKTITDQDTFLPHWIHLYYRHVFCGQSAREALTFLKTHGATHLMLTEDGLKSKAWGSSYIGSDENSDRRFRFTRLISLSDKRLSRIGKTPFLSIEVPDITSPPNLLTARLIDGNTARLPYVAFKGRERYLYKTSSNDNRYGGIILYYDTENHLSKAYHVPTIGWQSLSVRLYILGDLPNIFLPIYPTDRSDTAPIKIWEIRYPPDIQTDAKFLATQPEGTDEQ